MKKVIENFPAKHFFSTRQMGDMREKVNYKEYATGVQVHKNNVEIVQKPGQYNATDGLVTNKPGIKLCIFTADCAPLLLVDPINKIIGNLHCGWKPFVADIVKTGVDKMRELGAKDIYAAIGPCINECCFETGEEVAIAFEKLLGKSCWNNRHSNLRAGIELRLNQLGITEVYHINECTCCNVNTYFSYRAENGNCGRLGHVIEL
ncbi:MAG: peptidoglycan editing factor PgeF [Coriobacteriia bacterium]|nr:peptidoglycan editing factor PgeF [Coriobacteriia bacterium]